ncbi:hypothetical protein NDU88_001708 [Pleurodeles waltl]|uniref:Uncharacterized protein n=1 Tax=Pleurodeles waltl TaxID=8319 RepID=A0AAV7NGI3_PLEWA|nr:hypothetical protein NDU88_001708 [Pleurodeles waltl]
MEICDLLRYAPPGTPTLTKTTTDRGTDRVGEHRGDACMNVVEVSASEVCVLLGVVMLVVDVDVVYDDVSVDVTGREVEEKAGEIVRQ